MISGVRRRIGGFIDVRHQEKMLANYFAYWLNAYEQTPRWRWMTRRQIRRRVFDSFYVQRELTLSSLRGVSQDASLPVQKFTTVETDDGIHGRGAGQD